jgi:sialate O-acetylesterase
MSEEIGVIVEEGLSDWQIVQQEEGMGVVRLKGRWISPLKGKVEVRVAMEDTGVSVVDWAQVDTWEDGFWEAVLRVPAGGLYRLETRLRTAENLAREWSPRGDMRHFWGVGDVWVIAGQSNSAGYGRGPYEDPAELGVHLFRNNEQWALASHPMNDSTATRHAVNREAANPGHSPYLQFARLLKRELGYPIGLVQTALGGSPLVRWNPKEEGESDLFDNMVQCVDLASGRVRGILWYQGESDAATEESATSYERRFGDAVGAWRQALGDAELPILTVQLNRVYGRPEGDQLWTQVREAQRRVAESTAKTAVVPAFDLPLSDLIHNSPAGNMLLGERLARSALFLTYHVGADSRAPNVEAACRVNGSRIELRFAHVVSRMDCIDEKANCFRVEDEDGEVPVAKVSYPMDNTVVLALERPLRGGAQVHGGWGADPDTVPMDMERFVPMLGFYGLEIQV